MENRLCNDIYEQKTTIAEKYTSFVPNRKVKEPKKKAILDYVEHDYFIHCISLVYIDECSFLPIHNK